MPDSFRVLLVGNYARDRQHSMLGFGAALSRGLVERGIQFDTVAPHAVFRVGIPKLAKWTAYVDKLILFPRALRRAARRADIVHILDQGNGVYVNHLRNKPHLVTCHDLLAIRSALGELPYWTTGRLGKIYQAANLSALRRANFVACVSTATLRDARRLLRLPEEKLRLIPNDLYSDWTRRAGQPPSDRVRAAGVDSGSRFFLHVGDPTPYKYRVGAINIFNELVARGEEGRLVLAGRPLAPHVRSDIGARGVADRHIELISPSHEELEWLYSNAIGVLVTSRDEGFGLPILEAQACGSPVFVTNKEPMTEVAGDGAIRIDPEQPQAAAAVIQEALRDPADLILRGYTNADNYRCGRMASAYAKLYRELAGDRFE